MKTQITLKDFSALSFDTGRLAITFAAANPGSQPQGMSESVRSFAVRQAKRAEKFREMLHRRSTTPFASAIACHRWGINE